MAIILWNKTRQIEVDTILIASVWVRVKENLIAKCHWRGGLIGTPRPNEDVVIINLFGHKYCILLVDFSRDRLTSEVIIQNAMRGGIQFKDERRYLWIEVAIA
jgi:hypothetical protein